MKRSVAELLVRRLLAVWVARHLIKHVPVRPPSSVVPVFRHPPNYEPGKLAPAELPGLHFEDPNPARKYAKLKWEFS